MTYSPAEMIAAYGRGTLDLDTLIIALRSRPPSRPPTPNADPNTRWHELSDLNISFAPTVPDLLAAAVGSGAITTTQEEQIYAAWIGS